MTEKTHPTVWLAVVMAAAVLLAAGVWWWSSSDHSVDSVANAPASSPSAPLRHIVVGGGSTPESNEFSIEQDLAKAADVLADPGVTLYAAGPETAAVRITVDRPRGATLRARLGRIFNPRPGRGSTYRGTELDAAGPASPETFLETLAEAAQRGDAPLSVYVAGHGDRGEVPADNAVVWWGNRVLTAADLAVALDAMSPTRRVRFVMTTCFSGGFAEIAFTKADPQAGAREADVCGLFASTWDREAGGCDPNPDRGVHEGYGVHVLEALDGETAAGTTLGLQETDFDDDGTTSMLDAHTHARLNSASIDVPTTTSERYLRNVVKEGATGREGVVPHEDVVIARLGERLGVSDEATALAAAKTLDEEIAAMVEAETEAAAAETEAYWRVASALLARWPVLDDPWHPDWSDTIDDHGPSIARFLDESPEVAALAEAMANTDAVAAKRADMEAKRAPYDRLLRAWETRRLATTLADRGGASWARFQRFRACENGG